MSTPAPAPFDRTFVVPQNGLPWAACKTPGDILNFSFNCAGQIGDDPIASAAWSVESSDLTIGANGLDETLTIATALISGGVSGNIYNVTAAITTQTGVEMSFTFQLSVTSYNW